MTSEELARVLEQVEAAGDRAASHHDQTAMLAAQVRATVLVALQMALLREALERLLPRI